MTMRRPSDCQRGFTLVELLVTMSLAGILAYTAIPSLTVFKRNAELTSATNALVGSIAAARSEAMKRGLNAMIVPSSNNDWAGGWVVFVDVNRNGSYDAATDVTISQQEALQDYFSVTGAGTASPVSGSKYIMFDASGYGRLASGGYSGSTLSIARNDLASGELLAQTRRIKVATTGRVRSCKPVSASDALCSSTGS